MKIKTAFWIGLFVLFFHSPISANEQLPLNLPKTTAHITKSSELESCKARFSEWVRQDNMPNRLSFPTRTGFVLLRKEDIVYMEIDSKSSNLILSFRKNGATDKIACTMSLSKALEHLSDFPFLKVSRSAIVNINEVSAYEGTRRDACLVMSDDSKVKVSRSMTGVLHDWISGLCS